MTKFRTLAITAACVAAISTPIMAQVNAPAPATVGVSSPAMPDTNASRSNELAPDPFTSTPKAPMLNLTNTQPAPIKTVTTANYKMTREQCRNLSKAQGYTQEDFTARSIYCDKHYAADTFDKNHPAEADDMPAAGM